MLAKVNFNKIAEEMDMRREEKRREERREEKRREEKREDKRVWSVWCMLCGLCAQVYDFHFFFACDGGGAVDLPQRVLFFFVCFSLQFQALFHMLSNVNMWKIA